MASDSTEEGLRTPPCTKMPSAFQTASNQNLAGVAEALGGGEEAEAPKMTLREENRAVLGITWLVRATHVTYLPPSRQPYLTGTVTDFIHIS